jgi:dTDP-4-amino-4,6-dideoxygalactose transaminase
MTDLQAALGISQLGQFHSFLDRRAVIAAAYRSALGQISLELPVVPPGRSHIYYRFVVRLTRGSRPLDEVLAGLEQRGVQCRRPVFRSLHRYLGLEGYSVSEEAGRTVLSLPIYPSMTDEEIHRTIRALCEELT